MVNNKSSNKGRLSTCRYCKHQFKISEELKQEWYELKNPCPNCKTLNCNLPPIEKKLKELEDSFYLQKSDLTLSLLYEEILKYSKSICIKMLSKKFRDDNDLDYFSHKATVKVVEQYLRVDRRDKEDFKIKKSFAGYIAWKIKEAFFEKEEYDCAHESMQTTSVNDAEDYDGNYGLHEYDYISECSKLKQVQVDIDTEDKNKELQIYFNSVIENGELKLLSAILNHIKFGENKSNLVFQFFGNDGKGRFIYIMNQFRKKLSEGYFA